MSDPTDYIDSKSEVGSSREKFDVWPGGLITDTHLKIRLKSPVIDAFYFL